MNRTDREQMELLRAYLAACDRQLERHLPAQLRGWLEDGDRALAEAADVDVKAA